MLISASIIVKNEASILPRMLDSVSQFADEIVIVDTGSTDKTKEIASAHPKVRLFESEKFNKDTPLGDFEFGVAKNEAIDKCSGEWVVWWDADDVISRECSDLIISLAESSVEECVYSFPISSQGSKFYHCRMFKRSSGVRFDESHACHEYLNTLDLPHLYKPEVVIDHTPEEGADSGSRNLAILEKDYYGRNRRDQRTLFYLGNSYREYGEYEKSIRMYDEYLDVSEWKEERYFARYYKAISLKSMGLLEDALQEAKLASEEDGRFAEAYCLIGDIYFDLNDFDHAKFWFEKALSMDVPDALLFVQEGFYNEYPSYKLGELGFYLGKIEELSDIGRDVYTLPSDQVEACLAMSAIARCAGDSGRVVGVYSEDDLILDIAKLIGCMTPSGERGIEMEIPYNLKGKHVSEWYARSMGEVKKDISPPSLLCGGVAGGSVILGDIEIVDKSELRSMLRSMGKNVIDLSTEFPMDGLMSGDLFIGESGVLSQLAAFLGIHSIVLWKEEGKRSLYGWESQTNLEGSVTIDDIMESVECL